MSLHGIWSHRTFAFLILGAALSLGTLGWLPARAETLRSGVTAADINVTACKTYRNREGREVSEDIVLGALGLTKNPQRWQAGRAAETGDVFHHLVAFKKDMPLGAIFVGGGHEVRYLKAGSAYPPDPQRDGDWVVAEVPPNQSMGRLVTLPVGVKTRAVLLTDRGCPVGRFSDLRTVRLFQERLYNFTPHGFAYGEREYRPPQTEYLPYPASAITAGKGSWVNVGKDGSGFIPAPVINDVSPTWFLLTWKDEQTLTGLWLDSNIQKLEIETFQGPSDLNPRAGTPAEWRKVKSLQEKFHPASGYWIGFDKPVRTRGLRLVILKSADGPVAKIDGLHALVDLGERAVPPPPIAADEPPPLRVPYQLAEDGNVSVVVNGPDGRRARNLVTRAVQTKGQHQVGWDLKDENGEYVAPGTYKWSALTWPDLQVRYEMTVYPNVSQHAPGNAPWLTGMNGSGGWLADHTPPISACAAGDRVYLGAYVAESGVSLIECDQEGRKRWGHHSFAAWTGAYFLDSDDKEVFIGSPILGTSNESVWAVDIETKKLRNVLSLTPTANRRRGLQGIAARDGKLYQSIRGTESFLVGATGADDVDVTACLPLHPERRRPRFPYEITPDPRGDFLRLFRLTGTPPGGANQHTNPYLETMGGKMRQQHLVLAFKKPVPIASVVFPVPQSKDTRVLLSVLKPDGTYPPNAEKPADWVPFVTQAKEPWDVATAAEGTMTRALRVTFARGNAGSNDPLDKLLDNSKSGDDDLRNPDKAKSKALEFGADTAWKGQLEGMKLLRRRFANVTGATIRVNSGKVTADGTWDAQRERLISEADPGIYMMEWKTAQTLRGLAIREIDGELTKVDVFTGEGEAINLADAKGWENVAEYRQARRDHHSGFESCNATARYIDGYVDFGREVKTRAVRLRIVKQWVDHGRDSEGLRPDLGGMTLDPKRCRVFGVAALRYLGGEAPVDPLALERIEVYDSASGKLQREIPLEQPGQIALDPSGNLHAISGKKIVRIDPAGKHETLVSDLKSPTDLAFDKQGNLYTFDADAERHTIRVYDRAGKYQRSIGTPGGFKAGPWDPTRLGAVSSLAIDTAGQLWVVENQYYPKRISVWTLDGKFKKELLGNTAYGGGGVLDPWDKSRLFYGPMEFELDWKTGQSRLKNLTWVGSTPAGEVPIRIGERTYFVTRPGDSGSAQQCAIVYRYEKDQLRLAAAMGWASAFQPLKQPELSLKLGSPPLSDRSFLWIDRNGDGEVQAEEVSLFARESTPTNFNRDLSIQAGTTRYQVKEFLAGGVPLYEKKEYPALKGRYFYQLGDGSFYRIGDSKHREGVVKADGTSVWTYPQEGEPGVQAAHTAKPWRLDQVVSQFGIIGHETATGDLGEFVILHGNTGAWNIWTRDGFLLGPLFHDLRRPGARPWSMTEHERGLTWTDLTVGEEHFQGYLCRTIADNKIYAVAGHNHISILEVLGLDKAKRQSGEITVSADDLRKAKEWESRRQQVEVYTRAPVIDAYRVRSEPAFDGKLTGFGPADADIPEGADFRIGYDDRYLYLAYRVRNLGPLKNSGQEFERLFKTGAALDLYLETDPSAKPDRKAPEAGDLRLLLTYMGKEPAAVLYRPVVPGTPADKAWRVTSPTGQTVIDQVVRLRDVRMSRSGDSNQYVLEAAIPLAALNLKPAPGLRLKMDWGVLSSGPDGHEVLRRIYWANRAWQIVADAPSEARLHPHLWGHVVFHGHRPGAEEKFNAVTINPDKESGKEVKKDVGDILDDLKTKKPEPKK